MTMKERVICTVYTGVLFCQGDELQGVYEYASYLIGRPIYTHELSTMADELQELSKPDFIKVLQGEFEHDENEGRSCENCKKWNREKFDSNWGTCQDLVDALEGETHTQRFLCCDD